MELYSVAETYSHQYKNMFVDIALYDATMRGATKIVIFLKVLMKAAVQKKGIQVTTFLYTKKSGTDSKYKAKRLSSRNTWMRDLKTYPQEMFF